MASAATLNSIIATPQLSDKGTIYDAVGSRRRHNVRAHHLAVSHWTPNELSDERERTRDHPRPDLRLRRGALGHAMGRCARAGARARADGAVDHGDAVRA